MISMFLISCAPKEDEISDLDLQAGLEELNDKELESIITEGEVEESKALAGQASRWDKQARIRGKKVRENKLTNMARKVYTERQNHRLDKKPNILKFPPLKPISIAPTIVEGKPIEILVGKMGYCVESNGVCSGSTTFPISEAEVSVFLGNEEIGQCITNQYGKCTLYGEQGEMYKIVVNKDGYEESMAIKSFPLSTHPDKQKLNVLLELKSVNLVVQVKDKYKYNDPIDFAKVSIFSEDGNIKYVEGFTNEKGTYVTIMQPGPYKIIVNKNGYGDKDIIVDFEPNSVQNYAYSTIEVGLENELWKSILKTEAVATHFGEQSPIYDVYYYEEDPNIRVVCQQPCPIPENILKKKTAGVYFAVKELFKLTQLDVLDKLKPVDIHLTSDIECGDYQEILMMDGYVSRYSVTRSPPLGGSYMCLWSWDDENLVLPLNPDYASQMGQDAEENALRLEGQGLVVHEYTHILLSDFCFYTEAFAKAFSFYISGMWDGNYYLPANFPRIANACDQNLNSGYEINVYNQCTQCGFSYEDISSFVHIMRETYLNGEGEGWYENGLTINQMMEIFEEIVGECNISWIQENIYNGC
jgi:hypothetical protein